MEVRIGILNSPRELAFESSQTPADVQQAVADAIEKGASHLALTDGDGRLYVVPTTALAYVEIGSERARRVGFVA
ncbi:DUF3107 domain-containing protein [uncultured Amnibacterium sp.]|uniref:DUF3107 domain-containing protein n=1 Tax=uncultured Amnibacterium sp. TaxID=1631851 RepID=UPI0035CC53E5